MKATIDRFGRVVVPKDVRVRLGLVADTAIEIDVLDHKIVIRKVEERSPLQREEGILVFTGDAAGDIASWVGTTRDKRAMKVSSGV